MGLNTSTVHIDAALSNMVIGYQPTDTIVQNIFPMINVKKRNDLYLKWDKGDFFRIPDTKRAEKTKGTRVEFSVSSEAYHAENYALVNELAFEELANADSPLNLRERTATGLMDLLMLDWEVRVASMISSGSNVGSFTTLSGTSQWSDYINSDPFGDTEIGKESIRSTTGKIANTMIIPQAVWISLKHHPDLLERIKYTQAGFVDESLLSKAFGVDRVLIPKSIKNTGEVNQADSFEDVWAKNVILAHISTPDPSGKSATLGQTFRWNAPELRNRPLAVERWNDPDGGNFENIRTMFYQDEKIVASELGYVIDSAVA